MRLTLDKRYLALPVSDTARPKILQFYLQGRLVLDLKVRLDQSDPDTWQYEDMGRFMGKELDIVCDPAMDLALETVGALPPADYTDKRRPRLHFTPARGWMNDPNGLVYYQGHYHLFFQHNPVGADWGNLHWGHAVSRDLVHWQQRDTALFPDERGMIFSGSGIVDTHNVTGLRENDNDVLLLFYTAAGDLSALSAGARFTQCLAYSTDGGCTFRPYARNPVVPHLVGDNRDPRVVYNPQDGLYYMALYIEGHEYKIFTSYNLLDWTVSQTLVLPGDAECPDLYPLKAEDGQVYWIFSGASGRYLVGTLQEGHYQPLQSVRRLSYGENAYASQTFAPHGGDPQGRVVRITWNRFRIPHRPFRCAMGFPVSLQLRYSDGQRLLCAAPVEEIRTLYKKQQQVADVSVPAGQSWQAPLYGRAQDIALVLRVTEPGTVRLSLRGIALRLSAADNQLEWLVPPERQADFAEYSLPLYREGETLRVRLLTDVHGVEVFTGEGQAFLYVGQFCDDNLDRLLLTAEDSPVTVKQAWISELAGIGGQ